jgi:hypothetical protein
MLQTGLSELYVLKSVLFPLYKRLHIVIAQN